MPKKKLSVVVNTKNASDTIERTLESVKFADEIVVVDAYSTDNTVKLAKKYTKRVYLFDGPNYVEPYRNFAISKTKHSWILVVDADEVISKQLKIYILKIIANFKTEAYFIPRKNYIFGKWITKASWWPDYQLRLFKKGSVKWQDKIHSVPQVKGKTDYFPAKENYAIIHHNYAHLSQFVERLNNYTSIQAQERAGSSPQDDFSAKKLFEIFSGEFSRRALMHDGVEDGLHGISLSLLQAFSESITYLKQWDLADFPEIPQENMGDILMEMQGVWRYWWADYNVRHSTGFKKLYWRVRRKFKI